MEFAESGCPISVLRLHCPEVNFDSLCSRSGTIETIFRIIVSANQLSLYGAVAEKCEEFKTFHDRSGRPSIHFTADQDTVDTIYRIILSVNQLSVYGAVAAICEEFEDHQDRTGQPVILVGQSIVLGEVKAETPVHDEDPRNDQIIWQQYIQQIELLSQENKVSKFCMDAGFIHVVEVGQYFMTKDTGEQFYAVACREYTLPRDDESSQPTGWIQGNTRIGPVLEVTTSYLHGKHGVEIRIMSLSRDNTDSWLRISHGSNKFVMDLKNNDTEVPEDQPEEQALQLNVKDFACR